MNIIADDPTTVARRVTIALYVWLACEVAVAATAVLTIHTFGGFPGGRLHPANQDFATAASDLTATIDGLVFAVTAIMVLRWIYRSARIAQVCSDSIVVMPGWVVARFFIPVLNLWRPFQGVAEIWRASVSPIDPDAVPTPAILRWWWGLWLASSLFEHVGGRMALRAHGPRQLIDAGWADLILFALNVPLVVVLVRIVRQLAQIQHALLTRRAEAIDADHAP